MYIDFINDNYPENDYSFIAKCDIMKALGELVQNVKHTSCVTCGKELDMSTLNIYDHEGGWKLSNDIPKQWVSAECSCGYHTSLNKLMN